MPVDHGNQCEFTVQTDNIDEMSSVNLDSHQLVFKNQLNTSSTNKLKSNANHEWISINF